MITITKRNVKQVSLATQNVVAIDYLEGAFTDEELKEIDSVLTGNQISLAVHSHELRQMMAVEELFPQIRIILSSPIVRDILIGAAGSAVYDVVKTAICKIHAALKTKKLTKIQHGEIRENVTPNVHLVSGKVNAILPIDMEDEQFNHFVDKFFESLKDVDSYHECYVRYNRENDSVDYITSNDIALESYHHSILRKENSSSNTETQP